VNRRRFLAAAGAAGVGALAGCVGGPNRELPAVPTSDWPQHAADHANTAATDAGVPTRANPAWDEGETHRAAPLVADGTVYTVANAVEALDARTGEYLWDVDLDGDADYTPALSDGRLVVPADQQVTALSPDDGERLWSVQVSGPVQDAVTLAPDADLVTLPVGEARLTALTLESGEERWIDETVSPRPAAIGDDGVYLTGYRPDGNTGVLRALDPTTGARRWSVDLESPDTAPVVTDDGLLVVDGGTLAVHDTADGARRRDLGSFGDRIPERPAVADGTVFVVTADNALAAIDLSDGTEQWRADVSVDTDAGPSVGAEAVVIGAQDLPTESLGGVLALDRADGTPRWEHEIEGFDVTVSTPPILADGVVYYASNESRGVVALGDLPPVDTETE